MSTVKHPGDWILPTMFASAGLLAAWFDGKWSCLTFVGLGYIGVLALTLNVLKRQP